MAASHSRGDTPDPPGRRNKASAESAGPAYAGPARLRLVRPDSPRRQTVKPLGTAPLGEPILLGLSVPDGRHHAHLTGPTGTGKSTALVNYVISEARAGRGVAVFDPSKGDLIRDLLERLPESVARRLVLIDPDEQEAPVALNLFDLSDDPQAIADQLVGVMAKVWAQYWGPRTEDLARHAVLTLAHLPGATLADLPVLLADAGYRRSVLREVRRRAGDVESAGLMAFWAWYDDLSPGQTSVQVGPLLSKLRAVLSRRFAASLFGAGRSTFRLDDILNGGVLLVRLPKGVLGDDTVRLVGSLLLAALLHTAQARADLPEADRLDASVVLDECHNLLNLPLGLDDALAEFRGLHVALVLAHQFLDQLSPTMRAAIEANARNKIIFSVSPRDARELAHHVEPYFTPADLSHRDAYGVVCRLVIDGQDAVPFSLNTRPAPPAWPGRAQILRAAARARGLSMQDRRAIAEARRLGPFAHTGRADTPDPNRPSETPTDPTDAGSSQPDGPAVAPPPPTHRTTRKEGRNPE